MGWGELFLPGDTVGELWAAREMQEGWELQPLQSTASQNWGQRRWQGLVTPNCLLEARAAC